jgi:hypothetical protein
MKKIVFFNQFHNGDCFVGKNYVREIMRQLPDIEFSYAHNNHSDIVKDLNCIHLQLGNIPPMDRMTRVAESPDKETVYVNTWVGCWQGVMFPFGEHINFTRLHNIWREYFKYFGLDFVEDPDYYLPEIDFSCYDVSGADAWLKEFKHVPFILFCNGTANSGQSAMGDFKHSIGHLAAAHQDHIFLLTARTSLYASNIHYVQNINEGLQSDLNQIAYLSQWADLIIGKNSGPFSYCQHRANLMDQRRTFFNFSKLATDCPSGGRTYPARCLWTPETDAARATDLIEAVIKSHNLRGTEIIL